MSRTLRYGSNAEPRLTSRIDRFIVRRHTPCGYDRVMELAQLDYARHVAAEVTPKMTCKPRISFVETAPRFGARFKPDHVAASPAEAKAWLEARKRS